MQNQIPKNWETTTLAGTAVLNYGKGLPEPMRTAGVVPVYSSSGISGYHNQPLVNEQGYIIGRKGTIGSIYYSEKPFYPIDTVYYSTKSDVKCDFDFFYYLLKSLKLDRLNADSAVPGLNRDTAYAQKVLLPTISEQQTIVKILSSLDDKIKTNNKIAKNLEEMAQTIFKEWFSKPDGKEYSFLELAEYINGGAFGKIVNKNKRGLPLIKIADLNRGITENTEWIDKEIAKKYYIENGDLIFSWSGSIGLAIWVKEKAILNQHLFNIAPKLKFSKGLLYFALRSRLKYFDQIAGSKATTMGHIKKEHLEEQKIIISDSLDLSIFDLIYQKLVQLKLENQKLAALRDLLLPKLMKGEIRV
jgi:type I restriction enzyme, S subunit